MPKIVTESTNPILRKALGTKPVEAPKPAPLVFPTSAKVVVGPPKTTKTPIAEQLKAVPTTVLQKGLTAASSVLHPKPVPQSVLPAADAIIYGHQHMSEGCLADLGDANAQDLIAILCRMSEHDRQRIVQIRQSK